MVTAGTGDRPRAFGLPTTLAMVVATLGLLVAAMVARAPSAVAAGTSGAACAAATSNAQVHFLTGLIPGSPDGPAIAGLTIVGFDRAACDGLPVQVIISGNAAGSDVDPANELLSTLDSTLDPCTGAKLGAPLTISGGSITLSACASVVDPKGAAYASVHDATQLGLTVADVAIPAGIGGVTTATSAPPTGSSTTPATPHSSISDAGSGASSSHGVGGVSASRSGGSNATGGQASGHHNLASTGVDIALLTLVGLVLILCGWLFLRRRSAEHNH